MENISVFTACDHGVAHMDRSSQFSGLASSNVQTAAVWSGHIYMPGYAVSISQGNCLTITPAHTTAKGVDGIYYNKSDYDIMLYSIYCITHEMSHQFKGKDHYCYNGYTKKMDESCSNEYCDICIYGLDNVRNCIMGHEWTDLSEQNLFCNDCKYRISNHLSDHH